MFKTGGWNGSTSTNVIYILSEGLNFPNTKVYSLALIRSRRNTANLEADAASLTHSESHPILRLVHWEDRQTNQRLRSYSVQIQVAKCIPFLSENSVSNSACCKLHQLIAVLPIYSFAHFCLAGQWCCGPFFSFGHSDTMFSLLFRRLIHSSLQSLFVSLPFIINSLRFHCFCLPTNADLLLSMLPSHGAFHRWTTEDMEGNHTERNS